MQGMTAQKHHSYQQAAELCSQTTMSALQAGQFGQAIHCLHKEIMLRQQLGDHKRAVIPLQLLAGLYITVAEFQHGIEYYEQLLLIYQELHDRYNPTNW